MKTLKDWAKDNNLSYHASYQRFIKGKIEGAARNETGSILITDRPDSVKPALLETKASLESKDVNKDDPNVTAFCVEGSDLTRINKSAFIRPVDRFVHIDNGISPFRFGASVGMYGQSDVTIRDAVVLCQKAYYNFSVFRSTIDLMTEFCVDRIFYKFGNKASRDFYDAYHKKINIWGLQDKWYREFFRSGNVFVYKVDGAIQDEDYRKITQVYGANGKKRVKPTQYTLPIRYIVLNPADINAQGNISFSNAIYYKVLSDYDLEALRNPRTPEDEEFFESLPPKTQKMIRNKGARVGVVTLILDKSQILASFYKKQDYEAFAIPMGYPVLGDLNFKAELRLMDQAIARTAQQAILLVTHGTDKDKGGINPATIKALQTFFENQSVARVIVADYTTKAEFIIPQIADILDPKKYEVLDRDIAIGLNNVLLGQGEKFANQHSKIDIFLERLNHARQTFLNEFLIPEMKRVGKELGFKTIPTPEYEEIDIKNDIEYAKIYNRMMEMGLLTAEEGITAIQTGQLPTQEDSAASQAVYTALRKKDYYKPLMLQDPQGMGAGRPSGTGKPFSGPKKVGPIGGSYSMTKIKDNLILAAQIKEDIDLKLREKHKLNSLNDEQQDISKQIAEIIVANESPADWKESIDAYISEPTDKNKENIRAIGEISREHGIGFYEASILLHSKI